MVAFNFQSRFADAVESGEKRQTIRLKARCKPGDTLQLYVGQRSKRCRLLGLGCCTDVRSCAITMLPAVVIGGRMLGRAENHALAKDDGFRNYWAMVEWFTKTHGGLPFNGWLIRWEMT